MAKVKTNKRTWKLPAYSLVEVIISSIIILVTFLMFSYFLGQLMTSRRVVPETQFLFKLSSFKNSDGSIDTAAMQSIYPTAKIMMTSEQVDTFTFLDINITDSKTGQQLFRYYTLPAGMNTNNLFYK